MIGMISTYNIARGFGFLVNEKSAFRRIYFHIHDWRSDVLPTPEMVVEFELGPSRKPGLADVAVSVRPAKAAAEILGAAKNGAL